MPKLADHSEKELLQRLAAGDQQAFNEIYNIYHHGLYLNILRSVRNTSEAEDIVQEVFFTLWQKHTTISIEMSIGGWLFTSSYNRTVDLLRKKAYEATGLTAIAMRGEAETDTVGIEEQYALLEQAIQRLSPQKKRVFELCKLQGLSYEKAAAELGISKYTVGEYLKEAMLSYKTIYTAKSVLFRRMYHRSRCAGYIFTLIFYTCLIPLFFNDNVVS